MKRIYFELSNGRVCDPCTVLPAYMAIVSKGKVKEIYTCFSVSNIAHSADPAWVAEKLAIQLDMWTTSDSLLKSLNAFVKHPKFWLKDTNHIENSYNRFIFIRFW